MSAEQLGGLCRQHARAPVGLDDYRSLFAAGGMLDTQHVDERADEVGRIVMLAAAVCDTIGERSPTFGRLSARDLFLILAGTPIAEATSEEELARLLDTLASPLLEVLNGSPGSGYRLATSLPVAALRLTNLAKALDSSAPAPVRGHESPDRDGEQRRDLKQHLDRIDKTWGLNQRRNNVLARRGETRWIDADEPLTPARANRVEDARKPLPPRPARYALCLLGRMPAS